jgi:hypothetical protein
MIDPASLRYIYSENLYKIGHQQEEYVVANETTQSNKEEVTKATSATPKQPDTTPEISTPTKEYDLLFVLSPKEKGKAYEQFLEKVAQAVQLSPERYLIVRHNHDWHSLQKEFAFEKLIAFGFSPYDMNLKEIDTPYYQMTSVQNKGCIFCEPLATVMRNTDKKKGLWLNMKRLFTLS